VMFCEVTFCEVMFCEVTFCRGTVFLMGFCYGMLNLLVNSASYFDQEQ
jgi:hypothetical protein